MQLAALPPSISMSIFTYHRLIDSIVHCTSRIPETLPGEVLTKLHAPAKPDYPVITVDQLSQFNAYLFGIPTRFGNFPAQWKVGLVDHIGSAAIAGYRR